MFDIKVRTCEGATYYAREYDIILERWQKLEPADFLKMYLLRNLPVYCKDDGLEDESFKIIKGHDGKVVWREGDTTAYYDGKSYKVLSID